MLIRAAYRFAAAALFAAFLTSVPRAHAQKDGPAITSNKFDYALDNLFYFDDSDVILGIDKETGNIWRSPDAGESWKQVEGQGQKNHAWDLWPHPYDSSRAYILGVGSDHLITTYRG